MAHAASREVGNGEDDGVPPGVEPSTNHKRIASAHIPNASPITSQSHPERFRRAAIVAINGASAKLIASDVTATFTAGPFGAVSTNPDTILKTVARVSIGFGAAQIAL
jgi:hypothetical protein